MATIMDRKPSEGESKGWQARMTSHVKAPPGCCMGAPGDSLEDHSLSQAGQVPQWKLLGDG